MWSYLVIAVVFILLLVVLLVLFLAALDLLVGLRKGSESFAFEVFEVLQSLADLLLLEDALHQFLVVLSSAKPSKDLHHVVDLLLFFGPRLVQPTLFLQVQ